MSAIFAHWAKKVFLFRFHVSCCCFFAYNDNICLKKTLVTFYGVYQMADSHICLGQLKYIVKVFER